MAFEPGGMADKLGNRYEGRWVAKQLIRLLNEEIHSVTVELIGPDERGVDLLVVTKEGTRQLQQCKARLSNGAVWSVASLKNKGILKHLKKHLSRDLQQEFALISPISAHDIADICESARNSNDNPKDFFQYQIQEVGESRRKIFQSFCQAMELVPENEDDLRLIFSYLKRTYFTLFPDDDNTWSELLTWTGFLLTGEPKTAISILLTYVESENKYRKQIYADELRRYIAENHGIYPKRLENDERIMPVVDELQRQFSDSIRPRLICGMTIARKEATQLIESIDKGQDVVVHGAAGCGKSVVLYELTECLCKRNIPYLPVRLDRRIPDKNAKKFGGDMGLPESPAYVLAGLATGRIGVLILDQLDAIRWTAAHSAAAMDVCKELLRQVRSLRHSGKNIVIVIACRTFDLENNPEIKSLISDTVNQGFIKISVRELSNEQLKEIIGPNSDALTGSQKRILYVPQNLYIWMQLNQAGMQPDFHSETELMGRFWENRRQILEKEAGISTDQIDAFLEPLLNYIEKRGEISAPATRVAQKPKVRDALISYGILQQSPGRIGFCHQRYLDYLIAERLLRRIVDGTGTVIAWLGPKETQSLFRREQLSQVLSLLADESPLDFLNTAKQLLESVDIRFHLKHLVLELIGQQDEISEDMGQYCLDLVNDDYWRGHVFETVFLGHHPWVSYLLNFGMISGWLFSSEEQTVNRALWLLRSVAEQIPDHVSKILSPLVSKGTEWPARVLEAISWREEQDSEQMFELRLQLARMGHVKEFVDWKSLSTKYPLRSIRLIEAVLSTWCIEDSNTSTPKKGRFERWHDQDSMALRGVIKKHPVQAWDLLMPHVERLTTISARKDEPELKRWREKPWNPRETDIARGAVELLILAGQIMAKEQPNELTARTSFLENSISTVVQEIIMAAYTFFPASHADIGIKWLISNKARFRTSPGYNEPTWMPALRLIKALSPHCSEELFQELENSIVHYHAPEEKQDAEYHLKGWRTGYFGHYWGKTQYFLLPALDVKRIRLFTKSLISVLKRKFGSYPKERFLRGGISSGGWVGSKLDPNLEKISDQAWLRIVESKKVTKLDNNKRIQFDSDHVLETSIHQFAASLSWIAKRFPERFGQLALRFPDNVHPSYVSAVLDGFGKKQPGKEVPQAERNTWQPASVEIVEAVLDKYHSGEDRETAMSFCRLIEERADENWSLKTIEKLVHFACNHPDPESGKLNVYCDKSCDEATVKMLSQNAINCIRGVAAGAIGRLVWERKDRLELVRSGIESLIYDPHPAVRIASLSAIEPALNIERDLAVHWFCEACKDDIRVAASTRASRFFNYIIPSHYDQVGPIIQKMAFSSLDDVAKEGSRQATARWLFHGFFEKELAACLKGTVAQRKGIANVAASLLSKREYSKKCQKLLSQFMNDPDKEVRDEIRGIFRNGDLLNEVEYSEFVARYIKSQAFSDKPEHFVLNLKNFSGNLIPVAETIFAVCEEISTTLKVKTSNTSSNYSRIGSEISSILLRLYEQAQCSNNQQIACRCLDIWDLFFENRIGRTIELTKAIAQ